VNTKPSESHHEHHHDDAIGFVRAVETASTERGLRLTPLRREVLQLVARAGKPVKAYDLLDSLRDTHGNAAPPTVDAPSLIAYKFRIVAIYNVPFAATAVAAIGSFISITPKTFFSRPAARTKKSPFRLPIKTLPSATSGEDQNSPLASCFQTSSHDFTSMQ